MRIPFSKPYRAIPMLDAFDDAACERMLQRVWLSNRVGNLSAPAMATLVAMGVSLYLVDVITHDIRGQFRLIGITGLFADAIDLTVIVSVLVALPAIAFLIARDWALRRAINFLLHGQALCDKCSYLLLGLREDETGQVRCPECGEMNTIDEALLELAKKPDDAPGASA